MLLVPVVNGGVVSKKIPVKKRMRCAEQIAFVRIHDVSTRAIFSRNIFSRNVTFARSRT